MFLLSLHIECNISSDFFNEIIFTYYTYLVYYFLKIVAGGSSILLVTGFLCCKARFGVYEVWGDLDFTITGEGSS